MNKLYIERTHYFNLLYEGMRLSKININTLREELVGVHASCKRYLREARAGMLPDQSGWDCGRQDAYGDMVDALFFRYEALKLGYRLRQGNARSFVRYTKLMTGGE